MLHSMYGHFVSDDSLSIVERLEKVAADAGLGVLDLALSWRASRSAISSVIAGATRPEQVEANAAATRGDLPADVFEAVENVFAEASS